MCPESAMLLRIRELRNALDFRWRRRPLARHFSASATVLDRRICAFVWHLRTCDATRWWDGSAACRGAVTGQRGGGSAGARDARDEEGDDPLLADETPPVAGARGESDEVAWRECVGAGAEHVHLEAP